MLVSPAEPPIFARLGPNSPLPERYGADFLLPSKSHGLVGVQRKEINDLIASIHDGRLNKELDQAKALGQFVLLIEGRLQWTVDGSAMMKSLWTRTAHRGLLLSVQSRGFWTASSDSEEDTCDWLLMFTRWLAKERSSLSRRPTPPNGLWGTKDNRDWQIHVLQGFPGIGYERAAAIVDKFGGLPFQWNVTIEELMTVTGVGKKTAASLLGLLKSSDG